MSGIAGIYHLDGRPVEPELLTRMTDVIAHRGPDGVGHWSDGPVGLGHRMLWTTPEALHEQQPLKDETGNVCLVLDGRVDNRDELKALLEAKGARLQTDTDAEIVLRAYECWGEDCPKWIIGDFAFVIWDGRKQQLFCARDILGIKPFYYYTNGRVFLFGSELQQFFENPTVPREPNEGMIGEYLASAITSREETLFQNILRLPPAHFLIIQPGRLRKECYWDLDLAREVRYPTDTEYVEHFLELFKEAVRCRWRSYGPVGAELSGGLDSSSVVGMVQHLFKEGMANTDFETFSLIFPGEAACDESNYIRDVVRMWNLKSNEIEPKPRSIPWYVDQVRRYQDHPEYPNGTISDQVKVAAREKGIRVLLTGFGGDECLTGSYYHYADLLRHLKLFSLIKQASDDKRVAGIYFPATPVWRFGLRPLLVSLIPAEFKKTIRHILGRQPQAPPWLNSQFAQKINLNERLQKQSTNFQSSTFAQRHLYHILTSGWAKHSGETDERAASWFGLEQRHPLRDRRLLEFCFALPEDQRWRQDQTKYVLRQAMRGLLPETVRRRLTKADFSHTFPDTFQAIGGENIFDSLTIVSIGWVDERKVREMYQQMMHLYRLGDEQYPENTWPLWNIFGIELWFKEAFQNHRFPAAEKFGVQEVSTHLLYSGA
jgi:asparagine synthase (glutamine-hydrolysing)